LWLIPPAFKGVAQVKDIKENRASRMIENLKFFIFLYK
jgi:hypothetical protein